MSILTRVSLAIGIILAVASCAAAQTAAFYTIKIYRVGEAAPMVDRTLPASAFPCGLPKVTGSTENPTKIVLDDPADVTRDCVYQDDGTGPLLTLPFGTQSYIATASVVNIAGVGSAESAPSAPFSRPGAPPTVPANVRVAP